MANGPGVSVQKLKGSRWRVRWREETRAPGGEIARKERSKVVSTEAAAIDLRARVLRTIEAGELFEPEVREVEVAASIDEILVGWARAQAAKRAARATLRAYQGRIKRALRTLRLMHELPDDSAVSGRLLTRENVIALNLRLQRDGLAEGTIHGILRTLTAAWTWACDDPETYPGIAPAPRDRSSVLPMAPLYTSTLSPTLAECDAVLRALAKSHMARMGYALPAAILSIRTEDLDLTAGTLTVKAGKSRREKAERRTIPLAPPLLAWLPSRVELARDGWLLRTPIKQADVPSTTLRRAWKKAVEAGEARQEVWRPSGRAQGRPDHAFRAAFQHHLVAEGVREEVIDMLVGHGCSVRDSHYVDASARWEAMKEAVAKLPAVDWREVSPP